MVTVYIKDGYLGQCAHCLKNDAKHKVFCKFDPPIKSTSPNLPDIEGVWEYICDDCLARTQSTNKES